MFRSLDCEVIVYWPKNLLRLRNVELINQIYSLQIKWLSAFDGSKWAGYSKDYNRENVAFVNPSVKSFSKLTVQPVYVNTSAFYASFQLLKIIKTRQHIIAHDGDGVLLGARVMTAMKHRYFIDNSLISLLLNQKNCIEWFVIHMIPVYWIGLLCCRGLSSLTLYQGHPSLWYIHVDPIVVRDYILIIW